MQTGAKVINVPLCRYVQTLIGPCPDTTTNNTIMADRDDSGAFVETYPEAEFTDALEELGGSGTTQEVADAVGCAYRTAHAKLSALTDSGDVDRRRVGQAYLWMYGRE